MKNLRIEIQDGAQSQTLVDPFYAKNGSQGLARPEDVFFLAMLESELVGCVRFCVEEKTPLLRTMMIDQKYRRSGIGLSLLKAFASFLDENSIRDVFCLPYAHLDQFYGKIGFQSVDETDTPAFLLARLAKYRAKEDNFICMRRP